MKKLTRILVTCLMILSLSVTAFAAELPKGASERGYSFYYRDGEDGIIETPLEGEITVSKEVSEFSLTFYREEQTKTNIIESPTANAAAIAKNEFLVVNYMFLCANEKAKDNFNVSFEIPEKIETMVGTSLLEIEEDKEMTKTAISALYLDLTPEQRESLKVYKMLVSFTKKTDRGFIVQLLFDTDILGEHQYIGAFCPLIIQ